MFRRITLIVLLATLALTVGTRTASAGGLQLGVGAHYWQTIDSIDVDDFDEDGLAWFLSARLMSDAWVHLGLELEQFPKNYGGSSASVYAPAAYLVVGRGLYGALGIGGYYSDGSFSSDPFYAMRVGLMVEVLPMIYLDINGNYRFNSWGNLSDQAKEVDTDTVTLAAAVRIAF